MRPVRASVAFSKRSARRLDPDGQVEPASQMAGRLAEAYLRRLPHRAQLRAQDGECRLRSTAQSSFGGKATEPAELTFLFSFPAAVDATVPARVPSCEVTDPLSMRL